MNQRVFMLEKWVARAIIAGQESQVYSNLNELNALLAEGWRVVGNLTCTQDCSMNNMMYRGACLLLERENP